MRLFIALMFISLNVLAADWNNLEVSKNYKLSQSFQLPQLERSRSLLDFSAGDKVVLKEIFGLDQINVVMFRFEYKNCPGKTLVTDMEIIPVKNTSPVIEVGAQLQQNCLLEVFIENKDLMTPSFFE